jgi:hypothetical protein
VPIHVRVWFASPARLGFQWAKLVCVWGATSRAQPSPAGLARAFGGARLAAGSLLAGTCVGGPETGSEPCRLPCLKHSWDLIFDKILEEYRELPVLWQVRGEDFSNREKRDEVRDLLVQFTREKTPDADLCFVNLLRWTNSGYWNVRAKFGVRSCVCAEIYPSPAPESSSPSQTRTCMGNFRPRGHCDRLHVLYRVEL